MSTTLFISISDILAWAAIALCVFALFILWLIETINKKIKKNES